MSRVTIPNGSITTVKIANDAVVSSKIKEGAVKTDQIADGAVTNAKISLATPVKTSNDTTPATTAYVKTLIEDLVASAPAQLDTLNEIAAALNDDSNLGAGLTASITAVSAAVSSETSARINAITTETAAREAALIATNAAITTEAAAREAALIAANIAITTETNARTAALIATNAAITTESAAREAALIAANIAITTETNARTAALIATNAAITTETSAREAALIATNAAITTESAARTAAVTAEASARGAAISSVVTAVSAETSARVSAISSVVTAVSSETSARVSAISSVVTAVSSETSARVSAISSVVTAEAAARDAAISNAIASLVGSAPSALDTLHEIASALNNDGDLASTLTSLIGSVSAAVSTEASARESADSAISAAVSAEAVDRDSAISAAVSAEVIDRDSAISAAVSAEVIDRDSAISSAVSAEVIDRDSAISSAVSAEVVDRDSAISAAVSAEASARGDAISSVVTAVSAEAVARNTAISSVVTAAVSAEAVARNTAISSVVTAAVSAEAVARNTAISSAITSLVADAPAALDTLNEIASALNNDGDLASTLTSLIGSVSAAVSTEASARESADSDILAAVSVETAARGDAISSVVTTVSAEASARGAAISALYDRFTQIGADINGETAGDYSGYSVSLSADGSIVAIGAADNNGNGGISGHVRVYERNGSSWVKRGADIDGEAAGDYSGWSVSLSADGSIVAIGALYNGENGTNSGHVRVYAWNGSSWVQRGADIDGEAAGDSSGYSVSLSADGSIVAIGATGNNSYSGHVRVYEWINSSWVQRGADIDGEAAFDESGYSISLSADGSIVAIGARGNNNYRGHIRVYAWNGSSWVQRGADIDGEAAGDYSGWSVSLSADGSIVAIGATGNNNYSGHVRVYAWINSSWVQRGADIDGEAAGDSSGYSVSLSADGSIVAIGATGNTENGTNSGHVRVYAWNGSSWVQRVADIDGEAAGDSSGSSVSLSADGSIVAIGATSNDGNGSNSGHVRVYEYNEGTITAAVSAETAARNTAISSVVTAVSAETSARVSAISSVVTAVSAETAARTAALTAETSARVSAISSVVTAVSAETSARVSAISSVVTAVSAETAARTAALTAETSARVSAISSVVTAVSAEAVARDSAISSAVRAYDRFTQVGADINGEAVDDESGYSVSLSANGSIVAIGARNNDGNGSNSGHVRVYEWINSNWVQRGADINGEATDDYSGTSVSLSADGSIVAIGAQHNDGNGTSAGHVRVYEWNGSIWFQRGADIDGQAYFDDSGCSVSLSANGSVVAIGATGNDGSSSTNNGIGHVRVYEWNSSILVWDPRGGDIYGEADGDQSGCSVSLSADGSIVAIGAQHNDGNGISAGHVRVYEWINSNWVQRGADIDGEVDGVQIGVSVSLSADGSIVAIGARLDDGNGTNSGHARVYEWINSSWVQRGADIDGEAAFDESGNSVSLSADGSIVAIGAIGNDGNGNNSGHVRVYEWINSSWIQRVADINGEVASDESGYSVSLSADGSIVAIGARFNDGNGSNSGHVRVYEYNEGIQTQIALKAPLANPTFTGNVIMSLQDFETDTVAAVGGIPLNGLYRTGNVVKIRIA
jgi:hypothetical protein